MSGIAEKIKNLLPFLTNSVISEATPGAFDFIRSRSQILKELHYCQQCNNLVGVYCPLLGNGMFLVGVEEIMQGDRGAIVLFRKCDMSGHVLARRAIELGEISMIVPFNNPYLAPVAQGEIQKNQVLSF